MKKVRKPKENLIGKKFGMLLVLELVPKTKEDTYEGRKWKCLCDCGNVIVATTKTLHSEGVHSCGCYIRNVSSKKANEARRKRTGALKSNKYVIHLEEKYVEMFDSSDQKFLIDLEDLERVSQYCWTVRKGKSFGYVKTWTKEKHSLLLHRFIMNAQPGQIIDHINRDPSDNRKANLRFCTWSQNNRNKSNVKGYYKTKNGFLVQIKINRKVISKTCKTEEEAIAIRKQLVEEYF